jgi:hypothetical protein
MDSVPLSRTREDASVHPGARSDRHIVSLIVIKTCTATSSQRTKNLCTLPRRVNHEVTAGLTVTTDSDSRGPDQRKVVTQ